MADDVASQLSSAAREAWNATASAAERVASSMGLSTSGLEALVRPPVNRGLARIRWSQFGSSATVPFPSPGLEEPRMLLTIYGLARVLYDEFEEHRSHSSSPSPSHSALASSSLPLPPVTLALSTAAVWRFFTPALLRDVCLSPYCVLDRSQPLRLWSSVIAHLDAPHLLSNLAALIPDSAALERQEGSLPFAADVVLLSGLSSGLFVGWAVLEKEVLQRPNTYYAVGAVGLSSLAFALQVVRGESNRGSTVSLLGVPLPAPYAWLAQLALTHVVTAPDTSFAGHVAGVLAGIAHVYLLRPALRLLFGGSPGLRPAAPRPRFYGSGTTSGRPVAPPSAATAGSGGGAGGLRRSLRGALTQLGLAGLAVAVYALASSKRHRQPMSTWRLR